MLSRSQHNTPYKAIFFTALTLLIWDGVLARYIDDRKYIPPPPDLSEPLPPPIDWPTRYKPLRSDHWGQPKSPNPGAAQP